MGVWICGSTIAILSGDYTKPYHFRKYARVWLQQEYRDHYHTLRRERGRLPKTSIIEDITTGYDNDLASADQLDNSDIRLPSQGMQTHSEYTLYAHFWFLAKLLARAEKVRIFMDQDTGMRAACLGAFASRVNDKTIDAFFVRIRKDLTVSQKKRMKASAELLLRTKMEQLGTEDRSLAIRKVMEDRFKEMAMLGDSGDRWLLHPFPDMNEPEKAVCRLTNHDEYDLDHLLALYRKASLHSIDKFFMQVRRRISLLERPMHSPSSMRTWYGYSAYNPKVAQQLIDMFRVIHNYVLVGDDKQTPAMRIGLADKPYQIEDLLCISVVKRK